MTSLRPQRLTRVLVCLGGLLAAGLTTLAQQTHPLRAIRTIRSRMFRRPTPVTPRLPVRLRQQPTSPAIQTPQFENPNPAAPPTANGQTLAPDVIEAIDFRGCPAAYRSKIPFAP